MAQDFEQAKALFVEGIRCFEAGRLQEAEGRFQASLALLPGRASTLTNLAATQIKLAKPEAALGVLEQVLAIEPANVQAWCHRGEALADLARHDQALACYDKALAIDDAFAPAWYHRGMTLNALNRHTEALAAFDALLRIQPDRGEAWFRRGQTLQSIDRHDEALAAYDQAVSHDPGHARAWSNRGGILKDLGRLDEAARSFENAIANGADAAVNGYFLASVVGRDAPASAPKPYVEFLFDDYADKFDEHLVRVLHYQAHTVLTRTLAGIADRRFAAVLDLGCGTGLCGPLVKPMAERIDGVDLSRNMLDKARALGAYEELVHADISDHLQATDRRYDLVLSADVFIYIGDLNPVFSGVRRVTEPGGLFCFSAEAADDAKDFELQPSLRYAHSQRYIRDLARQHGFDVMQILQRPIRHDQRQPIPGLFAFLRKR